MKNKFKSLPRLSFLIALILVAVVGLQAQSRKLEDGWQFLTDRDGKLTADTAKQASGWRNVRVGLSWNAQFDDLRDYMGVAWYRTQFTTPDLNNGRRVLLRFGAVDYLSEVFVNGKSVGKHEGGYTPFVLDVTSALGQGPNEVLVRVVDPPMDEKENRFPEMLYKEIPHGKQNWYVQTGGIWQPVWLESKPAHYITDVRVIPKTDGSVKVEVWHSQRGSPVIKVRVIDPQGQPHSLLLTGGGAETRSAGPQKDFATFSGTIPNPQLWGIDAPNLYTVEVVLGDDRVTDRFGFRSFEARDGKFYLNGKPYYMIGALDQDFYPDTIYTPPSEAYLKDQMVKARRLGLNMLRCHIKVCDPTYLKVADEVGILVWYEVPSWNDFNHFSAKAAERGEQIFEQMTLRDWNRPSIVIQSIVNEGWGTNLPQQVESRTWLLAAFKRAKEMTAPLGRLIVDNSPCCSNFHLQTDIEDNHRYNSIPDEHEAFDKWVAEFASRPKWNFSPHGDAKPTGNEPLVLSEFGNWGLPKLPRDLPWWFDRDFGGRQVTRPAGLYQRFKDYKFDKLFPNYEALAEATQWHQFRSLKHEIEEIRSHGSVQGYVITEFTDLNWEANGLLTMWREPKVYAAELGKIQQPDLVMARLPKYNFTAGERTSMDVWFSNYQTAPLENLNVKVAYSWLDFPLEQSGALPVTRGRDPKAFAQVSRTEFSLPQVKKPQREKIFVQVLDGNFKVLSTNTHEVFVYPKTDRKGRGSIAFHDPNNEHASLSRALASKGYRLNNEPQSLLISSRVDERVKQHLAKGGRAIVIANAKEALATSEKLKVLPRAGSDLDGNWVTNFNWVRTDAPSPFKDIAFSKILGFEASRVTPRFVIDGVPAANYDDVLSGIFYGWLNNNNALAVQLRAGQGKLLLTTFRFTEYGKDPYATHLLDAMISYTRSGNFNPKLEL